MYGDLFSVIFDTIIVIVQEHHQPFLFKMNSIDKSYMCSDCITSWLFPVSLLFFRPPYFLRHSNIGISSVQFSSVQSLSRVLLFATPWTAARQASLSFTNSQSLFKLMSIESVMPSNHLILCHPLLLPPSIFLSIRVFSNESVLHI